MALGGPPPPLPPPPVRFASLRSHRAKHHARAGYRLAEVATGATIQGDFAHAAATIRDDATWARLLSRPSGAAAVDGAVGGGFHAMYEAAREAAGLGGWTPLHVAVAAGNDTAVAALVKMEDEDGLKVCRVDAPDAEGVTPLLLATLCCVCGPPPHPPLATVPPASAAPTALPGAPSAASSCHAVLLRLLAAGASPSGGCDELHADGPLLLAIGGRAPAAASALLRRGADFRRTTADGSTAATLALSLAQLAVLKALLRRGVDPNEAVEGAGGAGCRAAFSISVSHTHLTLPM